VSFVIGLMVSSYGALRYANAPYGFYRLRSEGTLALSG